MAVRRVPAASGLGSGGADLEALIAAEAISKRYPGRRAVIFPPVVSIFERDFSLFRGRRSSDEEKTEASALSYTPGEYLGDPYDEGDEGDEDDEDDDELEPAPAKELAAPRAGPDEMFWALRDISLRVAPGAAIGILGGAGAGKSTLLRILAGRAFPTEGRVVVRGRVAPLAADVQKALGLSQKVGGHDMVLASRLVGVDARVTSRHREVIEELAEPLLTPDGDPAPGATARLAVATTVVLPSDVILLDDLRGLDEEFTARAVERLRERLRAGDSVVLASRDAPLLKELCDEVMLLDEGMLVDPGEVKETAARHDAAVDGDRKGKGKGTTPALGLEEGIVNERKPSALPAVAAFNSSAALVSTEVQTAAGAQAKVFDARDELSVEIRLETAVPDTEVRCAVCFTPRSGGTGFRVELPEPASLSRPRRYVLVARILPGMLRSTAYEVRADAVVANRAEPEPRAISRTAGRIRIKGDERDFAEPHESPVEHWDGSELWRVEAEWSVRQEPRRR